MIIVTSRHPSSVRSYLYRLTIFSLPFFNALVSAVTEQMQTFDEAILKEIYSLTKELLLDLQK
jgi:hypothetical protein